MEKIKVLMLNCQKNNSLFMLALQLLKSEHCKTFLLRSTQWLILYSTKIHLKIVYRNLAPTN